MEELFLLARAFLARQLDNIADEEITMDSCFDDINADSINITEMIMSIEDAYGVEFPESDLEDHPLMRDLLQELYCYLQSVDK